MPLRLSLQCGTINGPIQSTLWVTGSDLRILVFQSRLWIIFESDLFLSCHWFDGRHGSWMTWAHMYVLRAHNYAQSFAQMPHQYKLALGFMCCFSLPPSSLPAPTMATANDAMTLQLVGTRLLGRFYLLVPVSVLEGALICLLGLDGCNSSIRVWSSGMFLLLFSASTFTVLWAIFVHKHIPKIHWWSCRKRGFKTISSWIIFLGTLLNFSLGTAQWAGLVTGAILETRILLVEHSDVPLEARIGIYEQAVMKLQTPLAVLEAVPVRVDTSYHLDIYESLLISRWSSATQSLFGERGHYFRHKDGWWHFL